MTSADIVSQIIDRPPLDLVEGLRDVIVQKGRVQSFDAQVDVVAAGASVTEFLVPINASLGIACDAGELNGQRVPKYEVVALPQLLDGSPCPYTVRAEGTTLVLCVPRQDFLAVLRQTFGLEHYLRRIAESQCLREFEKCLLDRSLDKAALVRVFAKISSDPVRLKAGERFPERQSIWFVEAGEIEVTRRSGKRAPLLLGPASFLGGEQLVSPFRWSFEACAATDCVLYEMPAAEARVVLSELALVDFMFDEPHLRTPFAAETLESVHDCVELPGKPSSPSDLWQYGVRIDVEQLTQDPRSDMAASIASVANLLLFLGIAVNSSSLRTSLTGQPRLSHLKIAEVIESYGVACRATPATLRTLKRHELPALVVLRGRLCVLLTVKGRKVVLHDAAHGFLEMSLRELGDCWDGTLLEASVADAEATQEERSKSPRTGSTVRSILAIVAERRALVLNASLLSLLTILLSVIQPRLAQIVLDEALTFRDLQVLVSCTAGILLSYVLLASIRWAQQIVFAEFVTGFDTRLGELFYRRALSLPMRFFAQQKTGDILTRLRELEDIRDFLSLEALQVVVKLASIAIVSAVLTMYSVKIAALALCLGAAMIIFQFAIGGTLYRNFTESAREATRATSLVTEQIAAISTVKAFGAARALRERWERVYLNGRRLALKNELLTSGSTTVLQVLGAIARVGGLWLAARAALQGEATPGEILAVSAYLNHVVDRTGDIGSFFGQVWRARTSLDNVRRILDAAPEESPKDSAMMLSPQLAGKIKIDSVGFRYDERAAWVLRDIELTIYPQQVVALVGRSGCGKTTLAHLIAGNLRPTSGRIVYDGVDGQFIAQGALRRQIGFVTQGHELFQGSIAENIAFADDAPEDMRIARVAQDAQVAPFVTRLPAGYASVLGEGGTGLSSGQMQRVSIARALYRAPSVCILDEATSQLDAESEKAIVENMRRIVQGRTSIIIAHRLSTIRQADAIFVIKDGRIVESGTHERLMAQNGHYTELFAGQNVGLDG